MLHTQPGRDGNASEISRHWEKTDEARASTISSKLLIDRSRISTILRILDSSNEEAGLKAGRKFLGPSTLSSLASRRDGDRLAAGESSPFVMFPRLPLVGI